MGKKCKKSSIKFAKFAVKELGAEPFDNKYWDNVWERFEQEQNKFVVLEFAIKNSTGAFGNKDSFDTILKNDPLEGFHLGSVKYREEAMLERPETYAILKICYKNKIYSIADLVHHKGLEAMIVEFNYDPRTKTLLVKTNSKNFYLHEL